MLPPAPPPGLVVRHANTVFVGAGYDRVGGTTALAGETEDTGAAHQYARVLRETEPALQVDIKRGVPENMDLDDVVARVDATGQDHKEPLLGALAGKVGLVLFWSAFCGPCMPEMERLTQLVAAGVDERVRVVALSVDGAVETFVKRRDKWPTLEHRWTGNAGRSARICRALGLHLPVATPTAVLIDARGESPQILFKEHPGLHKDLGALLDAVLAGRALPSEAERGEAAGPPPMTCAGDGEPSWNWDSAAVTAALRRLHTEQCGGSDTTTLSAKRVLDLFDTGGAAERFELAVYGLSEEADRDEVTAAARDALSESVHVVFR